MAPEDILLPIRFLMLTSQLIVLVAIAFDTDSLISQITDAPVDSNSFNSAKTELEGLLYAAIACTGIEYITLFLGVTIFFRFTTLLNIGLHICGVTLDALFYNNAWSLDAFIAFFVCFSAFPMLIELFLWAAVVKFSFMKY